MRRGALVILLLLAACCGSGERHPAHDDTIVLGSTTDVDNWNPYLIRQGFSDTVLRRIFLPLAFERGPDGSDAAGFEPALAEAWTFSDDRSTLTFRLREASWSDGRPITAADVVFTWRAQVSDDVGWTGRESKARIAAVTALDPRTVEFRFTHGDPDALLDAVEGPILPEHVFGSVPLSDWLEHDWSTTRIGSGPFLLEDHRPADQIVLIANPRYLEPGLPQTRRVVIRIVPDSESLVLQLLSGELDYLRGLPPREAGRLEQDPGFHTVAYDRAGMDFIGWNLARAPFDEVEVRRALTLAIDRRGLIEELLYGYGRVACGPVPSFRPAANRKIEPWPHDPREALRLLAAQGFTARDDDGMLERDGEPLRFRLITSASSVVRRAAAVKIQEQLRRIGVQVDVEPVELRTAVHSIREGDFDAYLLGLVFSGRVDLRGLFASSSIPPEGSNMTRYRSERVDRLLDELDSAETRSEQKRALDAIQLEIHRDLPWTFLYEEQRLDAYRSPLRDVRIDVPSDPLRHLERYRLAR